jgi:hypothetical protein
MTTMSASEAGEMETKASGLSGVEGLSKDSCLCPPVSTKDTAIKNTPETTVTNKNNAPEIVETVMMTESSPELLPEMLSKLEPKMEQESCDKTVSRTRGLQKFPFYRTVGMELWQASGGAKRDSYGNITVYFRGTPPVTGIRFFEPDDAGLEIVFPFEQKQFTPPGAAVATVPTMDKGLEQAKQRNICVRLSEAQAKWVQDMDRSIKQQMQGVEHGSRWFGRSLTPQEIERDWRSSLVETPNYPAFFKATVFLTDENDANHTQIKVYKKTAGEERTLLGAGVGLTLVEATQDAAKWRGSLARLVLCPNKLQYRQNARTYSLSWRVTHLEVTQGAETINEVDPFQL